MQRKSEGASKADSIFSLIGSLDKNTLLIEIIKRFFYQVLGIYIPALILILYFYATWHNVGIITTIVSNLPKFIVSNETYKIFLLFLGTVILGEAINAFTSWVTKISPVKLSVKERINMIFKNRPIRSWLDDAIWPVWINLTSFPVSFAVFDRYYLSTLDEDRKILAGKIGWTAFYRNLTVVFLIISVIQIPTAISALISILPVLNVAVATPSQFNSSLFSFLYASLVKSVIPLLVPLLAVPAFYLGYLAQITANKNIFWNAYRRNELRKILEYQYNDLPLFININRKFRKLANEYMVDRLFLVIDTSLMILSNYLCHRAEEVYREIDMKFAGQLQSLQETGKCDKFSNSWFLRNMPPNELFKTLFRGKISKNASTSSIHEYKDEVRKSLVNAYKGFYNGNYEIVISDILNLLMRIDNLPGENNIMEEHFWKKIKGYYFFQFTIRSTESFEEIKRNLSEWGWIDKVQDSIPVDEPIKKAIVNPHNSGGYGEHGSFMWQPFDPLHPAFIDTVKAIETLEKIRKSEKASLTKMKEYSRRLDDIYVLFGGYDYDGAAFEAQKLIGDLRNSYVCQ